jgi:hypothetical protein
LFAVAALAAFETRPQSPLDVPVAGPFRVMGPHAHGKCAFWQSLEQVARRSGVRLGFENRPDCRLDGWTLSTEPDQLDFDGLTPRQAFDRLVEIRPEFSWREIDQVVIVRPVAAWEDPANLLHRPVAPFTIADTHPHFVLHRVTESAQPSVFVAHEHINVSIVARRSRDASATGQIDTPVSVDFAGGVLLEALNAVGQSTGAIWQVGYGGTHGLIALQMPDIEEGTTSIPVRLDRAATKQR